VANRPTTDWFLACFGVSRRRFDKNGFLDILVAAWQNAQPMIYWNAGGMHFERERVHGIDDRWPANQGVTVADIDGDGLQDVALTSFEYYQEETVGPIAVLLNTGDKRFRDATHDLGFYYPRTSRDYRGTNGFSFADIDNDGDLDGFIAGYHGSALYRNDNGRFRMIQQFEGVHYTGAFGDVDNDSDLDLYITGERGDFVEGIFLNDGSGGFTLQAGMEVRGANGYCAQESSRVHFGVDATSTYDVEVRFTNATIVIRASLGAGIHTIDGRVAN